MFDGTNNTGASRTTCRNFHAAYSSDVRKKLNLRTCAAKNVLDLSSASIVAMEQTLLHKLDTETCAVRIQFPLLLIGDPPFVMDCTTGLRDREPKGCFGELPL